MAQEYKNIAVIHPAAIGDIMFGTPVAATLKASFPNAHLTYWTHESLFGLLRLCPSIDAMTPFERNAGLFAQRKQLSKLNADLIVDLAGSTRTKLITLFNKASVFTHNKANFKRRTDLHIVDSMLSTIVSLNLPEHKYPTLQPDQTLLKSIFEPGHAAMQEGKRLIALVPSVGTLRPHRAWPSDKWIALLEKILAQPHLYPVLVGGPEDEEICANIANAFNGKVQNLAGRLTLPETATLLSCCAQVVSADTGPAHLAVAVGTPVLGLYGPTLPARNGPYGNNETIDNCRECKCFTSKFCTQISEHGPGACMQQIETDKVLAKLMEKA